MTTALCFNCGETKFGAWCPCGKCGVASSGDRTLDILFSDHRMSVTTLKKFGDIIKTIAAHSDDPELRFWAFISYLSDHPTEMLSATPPPEIALRVENLLAECQLPIVEAELKPVEEDTGPPQRTMPFPEELLRAFTQATNFVGLARVQVRRKDGIVVSGYLMELDGAAQLMIPAEIEMLPDEIVAIRTAPGCLFGWLVKPPWIEAR
jgi:hypothetical protein